MRRPFWSVPIALMSLILVGSCSENLPTSDPTGTFDQDFENSKVYFSSMEKLSLEVVYEPGAEPYTGAISLGPLSGTAFWSVTADNLKALFQGRPKAVQFFVPQTLGEMKPIPAQNQTAWTTDSLQKLANSYRQNRSSATQTFFFIAFLKGYFAKDGVPQPNVIGVSVGGTTIIAIFKEVVQSTGVHPNGMVPKFVEQSTLVHEIGHTLGLVENGIPATSAHHDSAHGAHCTNSACTMYYLNEGKSDAVAFVEQVLLTGSKILFGGECLQDARSYSP